MSSYVAMPEFDENLLDMMATAGSGSFIRKIIHQHNTPPTRRLNLQKSR